MQPAVKGGSVKLDFSRNVNVTRGNHSIEKSEKLSQTDLVPTVTSLATEIHS